MNKLVVSFIVLLNIVLSTFCLSVRAQNNEQRLVWKDVPAFKNSLNEAGMPVAFRSIVLDTLQLKNFLKTIPLENNVPIKKSNFILSVPMPDKSIQRFRVVESPIMESELAAKFPTIKTYSGQGIDDQSATIKFDYTSLGFHAMVYSPNGTVFIDPINNSLIEYVSFYKSDLVPINSTFNCHASTDAVRENEAPSLSNPKKKSAGSSDYTAGSILRRYRLALACTGEYAQKVGGAKDKVISAMTTSINRVNGVYELELSIRMVLVSNNDQLVYLNSSTDPYNNADISQLLTQNQSNIDKVIGSANYDIGHVFSTSPGGGMAQVQAVCNTSFKAQGATGKSDPTGDKYDIDYVAHEIGHQFGGLHCFNSVTGDCGGGNRTANSAYEPGSGITIMAYAGICGSDNLALNSIPYFHTKSFDEIEAFVTGTANNCANRTATGNNAPVVDAGINYTIPVSTPFIITGKATDADADVMTYSWEQFDLGNAGSPGNSTETAAPLFRPFPPKNVPFRVFPQVDDVRNNTTTIGEILPSVSRAMNFRLTARDNSAGGGGVAYDIMTVNSNAAAGPFQVTLTSTVQTWIPGQSQSITWNVAGTNLSPINCANVCILLSRDGGQTFTDTIVKSTANDGQETIIVPNKPTKSTRIIVKALGNIFFNMSKTDYTITPALGINNALLANSLEIYPNPTNNTVTVKIDETISGNLTIQVVDALGRLIDNQALIKANTVSENHIDLSDYPEGMYFIKLSNEQGSSVIKKIIKF